MPHHIREQLFTRRVDPFRVLEFRTFLPHDVISCDVKPERSAVRLFARRNRTERQEVQKDRGDVAEIQTLRNLLAETRIHPQVMFFHACDFRTEGVFADSCEGFFCQVGRFRGVIQERFQPFCHFGSVLLMGLCHGSSTFLFVYDGAAWFRSGRFDSFNLLFF
ncbi:hypothetical protein JCM21738_4070 [Mesobacillus boroniphilus JCM 21738]|uniref:Uncharacterized protein n=1 Tax=Mesobacillus boroniphilus JCM 21738 TaxID=1294265 RepID=W4RS31_9BACI|nr:hypothetical protein JCM21738_4070 [Mesobacillus boroniphilus JCM 21738]